MMGLEVDIVLLEASQARVAKFLSAGKLNRAVLVAGLADGRSTDSLGIGISGGCECAGEREATGVREVQEREGSGLGFGLVSSNRGVGQN
jgi:hypothetical protein